MILYFQNILNILILKISIRIEVIEINLNKKYLFLLQLIKILIFLKKKWGI